jgi:hypothetical protein
MDLPKHTQHARSILKHVKNLRLGGPVLERLGTFSVLWGQFETMLEPLLWALRKESVDGVHPSTDRKPVR